MKKIINFFVALFFISSLNANTPETQKEAETPPQPVSTQETNSSVLKVGTSADYRPFEYISMNFEIIGFDIDLLNLVSKKAGFDYEIVEMPFEKLASSLEDGSIDMIVSAVDLTEERKAKFPHSNSYFESTMSYLKNKHDDKLVSIENLNGKRLGVQKDTSLGNIAKNNIKGVNIVTFSTSTTGISDLKSGNLDAILLDTVVANDFLARNPTLAIFYTQKTEDSDGFAMFFAKDKFDSLIPKINAALEDIKNNGSYEELLKKYKLN